MTTTRTILITGGAGGIGNGIARAFIDSGDRVILADRDKSAVVSAAAEIGAEAVEVDIANTSSVSTLFTTIAKKYPNIDILVNNAGILSVHGAVTEISAESYRSILDVNVIGTFQMIQEFARHRIAAGGSGAIVNISSVGGRQPTPGMGAYESSKAAVDSITRWAAIELGVHNIRVNAVAPGPVLTPELKREMPEGSSARAAWAARVPLGDLAQVENVAAAAVFLAGAQHITGVSLAVDGGQLLT